MKRRTHSTAAVAALLLLAALPAAAAAPSQEAIRLRNQGVAELENEQPAQAEATFRELVGAAPADPLGHANLAIALLRQQQFDDARKAIAKALERAPGDPQLLAIQGEIEQWSGNTEAALARYRAAAAGAPDDVEIQYALYRAATTQGGEAAAEAAADALERLVELRPDNLVVMLRRGLAAREAGDRTAATAAFLRLKELVWQAHPAAEGLVAQILEAIAAGDLDAARVPALRLENVLKITPMFRESLRELSTGIQGVPLARLVGEPPVTDFGPPLEIELRGTRLGTETSPPGGLAVGDFDGDRKPDLARLADQPGGGRALEVRLAAADWRPGATLPAKGLDRLLAADLDNDGRLDLVGYGAGKVEVFSGLEGGAFKPAAEGFGLSAAGATAAVVIDYDIEGDLDLFLAGGQSGAGELYLNALDGPLEAVGERVLPESAIEGASAVVASDLDRDGDLDLLVAHAGGLTWLDNLRHGKFRDASAAAGLSASPAARAVASADYDADGRPDLVWAGRGVGFLRNLGGRFEPWSPAGSLATSAEFDAVVPLDADNDGRLDLAVGGERGLAVLTRTADGGFRLVPMDGAPAGATSLAAADLDGDGDLDLVAAGPHGLHRLENLGGNENRWLAVRLRGLEKGNSKNNLFGLGATLEVRAGAAYQFREAQGEVTHFGLGKLRDADLLRVVWTNGVPQNRLDPAADQLVVEEQVLKGSCPFLYAWTGDGGDGGGEIDFVTDLLWGAPAGLPLAPGVWAPADPAELVAVPAARPRDGVYDLRVTEELWEAAFFDYARLWVVDHPAEVEVASSLKIVPGATVPERVHGTRALEPLARAWDARGADATDRVARRDEVYADGWRPSRYQGVAAEPWTFTLDLGRAPGGPVRLHLDGWIFPADASLNLAVAQRDDLPALAPRLEVETAAGWRVLMPTMGFPAGKTKTMVVDTPPLPEGARRLRIVGNQWLSWDRIAWSTEPADAEPVVVARLAPSTAELAFRGFSAPVRRAPNAPHAFDYARVSAESPWLPFPGPYTRYGDVVPLLAEPDDLSVILGPGDEMRLLFDASELPPPADGWRRTVFLESHGWDKDADRNTYAAEGVEPLPFRAMSGYPWGPGEAYPDTAAHREYREQWLTRWVEPAAPGPGR